MSSSKQNTYLAPQNTEEPVNFPSISQPKIVGCFSLDSARQYLPDTRNCQYVYKLYNKMNKSNGQIAYDLNAGIEQVIRKPESCHDEKIIHLLEFIARNKRQLKNRNSCANGGSVLSTDFVCFRGLLRLLMCSPYECRDGWIILATKYKGTIYLCAEETVKQKTERQNISEQMKRIFSYGFKFEQFILSDDPSKRPATDVPVNECDEFCCLFSTTLNGQRILYGAEMDGIETDQLLDLNSIDLNRCNFVELKVKLREQHARQRQNYLRFKLRNWWCQSFLVNIRKIIVGTRTQDGIVDELTELNVKDIPKQCQRYWSPSVCMEFCSKFLQLVAKQMQTTDSPCDVFRFEYDPTKSNSIYMKIYKQSNEFSILPEWFIQEMEAAANERAQNKL